MNNQSTQTAYWNLNRCLVSDLLHLVYVGECFWAFRQNWVHSVYLLTSSIPKETNLIPERNQIWKGQTQITVYKVDSETCLPFFNTLVLLCILSRVLSGNFFNMCSWKSEMVVICLHMISCNSRNSKLKLFSFLTALSIQSILKRLLLSWRGYPQSTNN